MDELILNRLLGILKEFQNENISLKLFYDEKKLKFFMTNLPPRQQKGPNRRKNNAIPLNEFMQTSTPTKSKKRPRKENTSGQSTPTPEKICDNFHELDPLEPSLLDEERETDKN